MNLPFETLTPILGDNAAYDPTTETTPDFMNGKFDELLQNDKACKNEINVFCEKGYSTTKRYTNTILLNNIKENSIVCGWFADAPTTDMYNVQTINWTEANGAPTNNWCTQVAYKMGNDIGLPSATNGVYIRSLQNGSWAAWERLMTTTKTSFACTPTTSFAISEAVCYKTDTEFFITMKVFKADGSTITGRTDVVILPFDVLGVNVGSAMAQPLNGTWETTCNCYLVGRNVRVIPSSAVTEIYITIKGFLG